MKIRLHVTNIDCQLNTPKADPESPAFDSVWTSSAQSAKSHYVACREAIELILGRRDLPQKTLAEAFLEAAKDVLPDEVFNQVLRATQEV